MRPGDSSRSQSWRAGSFRLIRALARCLVRKGGNRLHPAIPVQPGEAELAIEQAVRAGAQSPLPDRAELVSIVIPILEPFQVVQGLVESVLRHTRYPTFEFIFVGVNCRRTTKNYLAKLTKYGARFIPLDKGVTVEISRTAAFNRGAREGAGDYFLFMDESCTALPGWMNELVAGIRDEESIGIATPRIVSDSGVLRSAGLLLDTTGYSFRPVAAGKGCDPLDVRWSRPQLCPAPSAEAVLVRRSLFESLGGFDPALPASLAVAQLSLKARHGGQLCICLPASTIIYREEAAGTALRRPKSAPCGKSERLDSSGHEKLLADVWRDRLGNRRKLTGRPLRIGFAVSADKPDYLYGDYFSATSFCKALENRGHETILIPRYPENRWYQELGDIHLLVVLLDDFRLDRIPRCCRNVIKAGWIRNWTDRWLDNRSLSSYDMLLTSSSVGRSVVEKRFAGPVETLMLAGDPETFFPAPVDPDYECDLVFVGSYWGEDRDLITSIPLDGDVDFHLWGTGWEKVDSLRPFHRGPAPRSRLPAIYGSAAIVLEDHNRRTTREGFVNLRTFEAMMCGACVLSNGATGLEELFPGAIVIYNSPGEAREKIDHYLAHPEERKMIGKRAREIVLEKHTWNHRVTELEEYLIKLVEAHRESGD